MIFYVNLLWAKSNDSIKTPPQNLPVKVETTFYLWNLSNINEKDGTVTAVIYLIFRWHDDRLSFDKEAGPLVYTEDAASDKLDEIWWPEVDFVNASTIDARNKTLFIYPNGTVEYSLKVLGSFFVSMNLMRFPFDEQDYGIHLESFLWDSSVVKFVVAHLERGDLTSSSSKSLQPTGLTAKVKDITFMNTKYSDIGVTIHFKRMPYYFNYQILIPLLIVLFATCMMFFLDIRDLSTRLALMQGIILVFVAMRFMIDQDLPQINYLTFIDYIFFIAYFCCIIMLIFSCLTFLLCKKHPKLAVHLNRNAIWLPFILFFILYVVCYFIFVNNL